MERYEGKKVVIIGGTSGMGLATAKMLMDGGARVLVTGRSQAGLESAQKELGKDALVVSSDARSLTEIDALASRVKAEFDTFDLLFVNAGFSIRAPLESITEAVYDEMFNLNAKGPLFAVQKLTPLINRGGSVVLTTSVANVKGMPGNAAYGAAKAALRSFARTLAAELLSREIRVNAVTPGPIDTPIIGKVFTGKDEAAQIREKMIGMIPMKRWGTSEEIAKAVLFLAFDATFTTGAELPVDGGWSQLCEKMSLLKNKIAVVTGGSSGIGLATAKRFVEEGAYVFIAGRRQAELDKAVAEIGKNVTGVKTDISKLDDLDRFYETVAKKGKIDVIFAGAAFVEKMMTAAVTPEHFDKTFNTNARGTYFTVQKALPYLNDGASIILVASAGKNKGFPGRSTYSATKAALRSFARTWTSELKDRKIRTNVLSPGPVDTPMFDEQFPSKEGAAEARKQITAMTPLARLARPRRSLPQLCSWPRTKAATSLVSTCRSTAA